MADVVIEYDENEYRAIFRATNESAVLPWYSQLRRALEDYTDDVTEPLTGTLTAPWWSFVAIREGVGALLRTAKVSYEFSSAALQLLRRAAERKQSFVQAPQLTPPSDEQIISRLKE